MKRISVFGGGAWGKALAFAFSQKSEVKIVSRRDVGSELATPKIEQVDIKDALDCDLSVVAIATYALRGWLKEANLPSGFKVLSASKGIESSSGAFVSDILEESVSHKHACYLCGPSFAKEVVKSLPCALVVHSRNLSLGREYAEVMPNFIKAYTSPDVIGGEIAGAYKNVIAIAAGICDGMGYGVNAKSSLLARGLVEMSRFGDYFGAKMETFLGLSGAGDLFLTSNSNLSRNYRVGFGLSQEKSLEMVLEEIGEVAEGVKTTKAIVLIGEREGIYLPIANEVSSILDGGDIKKSIENLMSSGGKFF